MPSTVHEVAKIYEIGCIPGDGIGVDITEAAIEVLRKLSSTLKTFEFDFKVHDWSSKKYLVCDAHTLDLDYWNWVWEGTQKSKCGVVLPAIMFVLEEGKMMESDELITGSEE